MLPIGTQMCNNMYIYFAQIISVSLLVYICILSIYYTLYYLYIGEFGPSWHQAALKEHRKRAYDDLIAVAEELIKTGLVYMPFI